MKFHLYVAVLAPLIPSILSAAPLSLEKAERAAGLISPDTEVLLFCERCGETVPGVPHKAGPLSIRAVGTPPTATLWFDGNEVDVESTYVRTEPHRFANLAAMLGLPLSHGVSPSLRVDEVSEHGELIVASGEAMATAQIGVLRQAAESTRMSPPQPSPPVVVVIDHGFELYAAAFGGGIVTILSVLLLVSLRRRRAALIPRAMDLEVPNDREGPRSRRTRS